MSRPGRQNMDLDDEYMSEEMTCPRCSKKFKDIFLLNNHLSTDHNLPSEVRETIFINMGIKWFQNHIPPGRWKGFWAE